jgi:hypothetical protein
MYRQKDDSIVRSCQFRFVTPTQSICVKSDQRDLSYLPGQIEEPQRKVPPRTAGRTVFLTLNATAKRLPIAIHKSAKSELERLFGFVARGGGRRMAVQWRSPHQFPTALNVTDAVVSLVDSSADLAVHIGRVIAHPWDPTKWPPDSQDRLGHAPGWAMAHEVRHHMVGEARVTI